MPLKQCTNKDGVKGWSWGNGGCIVGKDAKKKAIKVGIKVEGPEKFAKIMKSDAECVVALTEFIEDDETTIEGANAALDVLGVDPIQRMAVIARKAALTKNISEI